MKEHTMALDGKRGRFVEEYLIDLNATQAAIRAGYSERTAKQQGQRLLTFVDVQEAVKAGQADRSERTELTQDWVIARLRENADRAMQAIPVKDKDGPTGEWKYEGAVANRALELLGKHLGMFADRHELTGRDGEPLTPPVIQFVRDAG